MKRLVLILFISTLFISTIQAKDDDYNCQTVMQQLSDVQQLVGTDIDNINALEETINDPNWNSSSDAWMLDALDWAVEDLIGDLNTASFYENQAHYAHCY